MRLLVLCAVVTGCHHDPLTPTPYDAAPRPDSPAIDARAIDAPDAGPIRCAADIECLDSNVCIESSGQCVPAAEALYVVPTGNDAGTCTQAAPCATIAHALTLVTATRKTIALAFLSTYTETIAAATAFDVTISGPTKRLGDVSTVAKIAFQSGGAPHAILTLTGTGQVLIEGVLIAGGQANQPAISHPGAGTLVLERVTVDAVDGAHTADVGVAGGNVVMTECEVIHAATYGIDVAGLIVSQLRADGNGTDVHVTGAADLSNTILTSPTAIAIAGGPLAVDFTTFGTATTALTGTAAVAKVENSIFAKAGQTYPAGVTINHSLAIDTAPSGT
ncbi:MAG: hypothetical protein NT062_23350, partial [Proteobacteria bacterium]|nr:hypothetical protein [Pseudomonadota bacterium]